MKSGDRKLRVAMVVGSLNYNNMGRTYPFIRAVQDEADIDLSLIGMDNGAGLFPLLNNVRCEIRRLPRDVHRAAAALQEHLQGVDVVHLFKARPFIESVLTLRARYRFGLLTDVDDWDFAQHLNSLRAPVRRAAFWIQSLPRTRLRVALFRLLGVAEGEAILQMEALARACSDMLFVNSTLLQRRFGGDIVYTGVDFELFDPARIEPGQIRSQLGLDGEDRVVGFLGTPAKHKGIDDLLAAFQRLRQRYPQLRLLVVGVDEHNRYQAKLHKQPGALSVGYVPAESYPLYYAACDVVVVPQRRTRVGAVQTPAKLLLGMAMARPIVATTVGDMPHILGEAGLLVAPGNVRHLTRAIERALQLPTAAQERMGALARERAQELCELDRLRATLRQAYRVLADGSEKQIRGFDTSVRA